MDERLISPRELGDKRGMKLSWIYANAEAEKIPHLKVGKYVRFRLSEIDAWLETQRRGPRVAREGRPVSERFVEAVR
jgi:excisionase family DNA binding protein